MEIQRLCGGGPHKRGKMVRITRRNTSKNTVLPFKTTFLCTEIAWKYSNCVVVVRINIAKQRHLEGKLAILEGKWAYFTGKTCIFNANPLVGTYAFHQKYVI